MENEQYYGHKTMSDGTHIPLSKDEAEAIWEQVEKQKAETAAKYPDEQSTLIGLSEAYHRLSDFGWRDAIYCPKDGSIFDVIEAGSTGIHKCHYEGEWPNGPMAHGGFMRMATCGLAVRSCSAHSPIPHKDKDESTPQ